MMKPYRYLLLLMALSMAGVGCDIFSPDDEDRIIGGVNFDELFAEPTTGEITQVITEWENRGIPSAEGYQVLHTESRPIGGKLAEVRIVSHKVDQVDHIGAIIAPHDAETRSLPVLIYAHGGDNGVDLDETLTFLKIMPGISDQFVFVVPSFRSESLTCVDSVWHSGGDPSPWDYDMDDALALLNVALANTPAADSSRIAVLGASRGGAVALLMAIRDPRIALVVDFFGPTDFFGQFMQDVAEEILQDERRDLPGLNYLADEYLLPLAAGDMTYAQVRLELVRRSAVYFASHIPDLQIHHGTADDIVPVSQGQRLVNVMVALGRTAPQFEYYIYEGGGHYPFTLLGSLDRTSTFLLRLVSQILALQTPAFPLTRQSVRERTPLAVANGRGRLPA